MRFLLAKYPVQIIQTVSQIYWTERIDNALSLTHSIKLRLYLQKLNQSLEEKINLINKNIVTNYESAKVKCLIMDDLNQRKILEKILDEKAIRKDNFDWEASFKYYYDKGVCIIKALNMDINYGFEYVGIPNSFVLTSATDRCFRTLINAFCLHYNGFITGTGDRGKTETIKYLGRVLGVFVKIFQCSTNQPLYILREFLMGAVLSGCWILFENFSNLVHATMSTLSQDVYSISNAKKEGLKKCMIRNKICSINPTCFVVASIKFGNFNKVTPQNLKAHFRTVTMLPPDFTIITEAYLYSYGFDSPKILARKLLCTLDMFENIIGNGYKYNLGIRKIKKVLNLCELAKCKSDCGDEESILDDALRTVFKGKIASNDEPILNGILRDIFPLLKTNDEGELMLQIDQVLKEFNLLDIPNLSQKITNVCEIISRNENIVLIGKLCSGKTSLLKLSKSVLETQRGVKVTCHFLNPNSLDYITLYGHLNNRSSQWKDGVITKIFRNFQNQKEDTSVWIIFDGAINSSWADHITNFLGENSFFTDSGEMLLCSERISLIFEVENINDCSPSLVSSFSGVI